MRVECQIAETLLDGDYNPDFDTPLAVAGVTATCDRCGHTTESYGTSIRSIRRCLVLMREECPEGESNFYVDEDG